MKRVPITQDQALDLITGGGCVLMCEIRHDSTCPAIGTGVGCNCEPDQQYFECVDDDADLNQLEGHDLDALMAPGAIC